MRRVVLWAIMAVLSGTVLPASAQRKFRVDELPVLPMDTLDTYHPEAKLVTFTNGTWKYYFPNYEELINKEVFTKSWHANLVFSYPDVTLASLPEMVELELVGKDLKGFHTPAYGVMTSKYGPRRRGMHKGVDIGVSVGDPIYATFEGRVRYAKYNSGGYGNLVIIRHPNGLETYYGHLCQVNVALNDYVLAGQVIGYGGNTGRSSGPHLHFEVRYCDQSFDPERIIDFANGQLKWQNFVLEKRFFNIRSKASDKLEDDDFEKNLVDENGNPLPSEQIVENLGGEVTPAVTTNSSGAEAPQQGTAQSVEKVADKKAPVTPGPNEPVYHTVVKGDTLYRIAVRNNTTVGELCRLNNMKSSDPLKIGKKLRVK